MQIVRRLSSTVRRVSAGQLLAVSLVLAITLVALYIRLEGLGEPSLWVDEAMSVVFASKPLPELLQLLVTDDVHPPLYPVLLHFWIGFAGSSEAAVRMPSVLFGVLLVPLIYATGSRLELLAEPKRQRSLSLVGLVGAAIAALSAFYIGYSQAARNYMAVTFMGLLSSYLLLRALSQGGRANWAGYALATVLALYTHYTAFLLLPFHLLFVLLTVRSYRGAWRWWGGCLLSVAVAYLPWLGYSAGQLQRISDYWPGTLQLEAALRTTLLFFVAGGGAGSGSSIILPLLLGLALLAAGLGALLLGALRKGTSQHLFFLLLYLVLPAALLLAVAYYRPKFDPRYLLLVTPAFYLTLAWGVVGLLRTAVASEASILVRVLFPCLGLAALAGTMAASTVYGEPSTLTHVGDGRAGAQQYGDYRGLVAYLESRAEPGDAVVLMMNAYHPYVYYSKQGIPWYPMEPFDDMDGAIIRLNRMVEDGRGRLWFILWQKEWADPTDYVMHTMETQAREVPLDASFGGIGLRLFELTPGTRFSYYPKVDNKKEAIFGGKTLEFWGWNVSSTQVTPGDAVQFDLHWRALKKTDAKLKTKLMLADGDLHLWAVVDEVTVSSLYPPSRWREEELLHDRHTLKVPVGVPPGSYQLLLLVYDENTMQDLVIERWSGEAQGTLLSLGSLTVNPLPESLFTPASQQPQSTWYLEKGRVELLRSRVSRLVTKGGERLEVELQWRAPEMLSAGNSVRVALMGEQGWIPIEQSDPLTPGYPAHLWRPGEPVDSRHWLTIPPDLPPGRYGVAVAVGGAEDRDLKSFQYAQISTLDVVPLEQKIWPGGGQERVDPFPTPTPTASPERELLHDIRTSLGL